MLIVGSQLSVRIFADWLVGNLVEHRARRLGLSCTCIGNQHRKAGYLRQVVAGWGPLVLLQKRARGATRAAALGPSSSLISACAAFAFAQYISAFNSLA